MRTRYGLKAYLSSDPIREAKDLGNHDAEIVSDGLGDGKSGSFTLAAGATDVPLGLCGLTTAAFLFIKTSAASELETPGGVTIKLNTPAGEEILVTPLPSTKQGHFLISTSGLTGLYASNPSSVAMKVIVAVAGD